MPERLTDRIATILSLAFAAAVVVFAAYKVVKLNGIEDPPVNMGLNFPPPSRRVIVDELAMSDPLITRSVSAPADEPAEGGAAVRPRPGPPPARAFALLSVIDGVAFVEVDLLRGRTLVPVTVGTWLPGGYRVESIERHHGRWRLVAGPVTLEQAWTPVQ